MRYYIIAGEASGDLHGSNLMKGIYAEDREAVIRFWGGDLMQNVFMAHNAQTPVNSLDGGLVRHYRDGAVMGFVEVLMKGFRLLGNIRMCQRDILSWKPDVVILIDYPGFNFRIAEFAHRHGFPTFYYIAPKVWASREGRIRKLRKYVDRLFIVFPFEIPYFTGKGIDFVYRGNPLVDAVDGSAAMSESRQEFMQRNGLDDRPYIALLAGSRRGEISTMMPVLREFAHRMHDMPQYRDWHFIVAGAPARTMDDYSSFLGPEDSFISIVFGQTQSVIRHAEAAVVNSGTASLETVLFGTPQAVGYITASRITYLIARRIVKVKYISLGNLVLGRAAFREFIQDECSAENLVAEIRALIEDRAYRERMLADYAEIRKALGGSGASRAVASEMIALLKSGVRA